MDKTKNQWWVRDVDEATKHRYKIYAVTHNITIGQAVALASTLLETIPPERPHRRRNQEERTDAEQSATK